MRSAAVAAADRPGLNDLVTHDRNGVLFDWDDPATAAERIAALARSAPRRAEHGTQGHHDLLERYSHAAHTRQVLDVYAEMLGADDLRELDGLIAAAGSAA